MINKQDCIKLLQSDRMQPFWDELALIEKSVHQDLRKSRDGSHTYALDALDRVKAIPRKLDSAAKGAE